MCDAIFGRTLCEAILAPDVFFTIFFIGRLIGVTAIELFRPAREVSYRKVILYDLTVFIFFQYVIFPSAGYIDRWIPVRPHLPDTILAMPLLLCVLCYLLIADFGHYWIHRLMHHKYLWRIHKWHHAPTYMYWLAGSRSTIPQQVLVNLPYIFAYSFLDPSPWWMGLAIGMFSGLQNDWMHVNVTWRSNWLEWFVVTPRYHHIHHSDKPEHYMANLAPLFTIWDRLFGTYVDPETVKEELSFGIGEEVPLVRLVIGV
ncbi:MAG: sterol desaturase family protein [Nitrospira defluvii]|nr:sterol desaturase family protein [Nitrospira defluvii]